jgi:predicted nucleic acid-binding protein
VIFVDTGAWFASAVRNDPDHAAAMRWLGQNREPLITTDYVLAETATLIRMRDKTARGHRLAVRVTSSILRNRRQFCKTLALPIYKRLGKSFGDIRITCSALLTVRALPLWKDSASRMLSLSIATLMNIPASSGSLAR